MVNPETWRSAAMDDAAAVAVRREEVRMALERCRRLRYVRDGLERVVAELPGGPTPEERELVQVVRGRCVGAAAAIHTAWDRLKMTQRAIREG